MGNKYLFDVGDLANMEYLPQTDKIFAVGNHHAYFLSSTRRYI